MSYLLTRPVRLVGLLALAAAMAAGCSSSSGPGGTPVASLPGHAHRAASGGPVTTAQGDQDMVRFAACMRAHGVQMPDPSHRPGHAGLSINLPTRDAATRLAYSACDHFMAPIVREKMAGAAQQAAPHLAALTRYAQCMRHHDINMLDPNSQGQLSLGTVPGITSNFGRYSPQFRAADTACRHLLPHGVRDDGSGP